MKWQNNNINQSINENNERKYHGACGISEENLKM
jgi:hypothetical protein